MDRKQTPGTTHAVLREIDTLIRARYPILYLLTHEEERLQSLIARVAKKQNKELFIWTATQGWRQYGVGQNGEEAPNATRHNDPVEALLQIHNASDAAIYLLQDFHPFLEDPHVIRRLRDAARGVQCSYKSILIAAPRLVLPTELEKEVTLLDIPLPDTDELVELLKSVCKSLSERKSDAVKLNSDEAWALVRAARGLTLSEAENAFARAFADDSTLSGDDVGRVLKEKQQIIRKTGLLEFYPTDSKLSHVGGLHNLKRWLVSRGSAFSKKASEFGLPYPKGVLLLGAPGCGKSLTAKAVATSWKMPLVRLDFGKIFSGLIGSSEENMRRALQVAEAVAPAVLWIDEIEKGLAGGVSGSSDGGTAARVFGTFLTWMQEKASTVFVVATANRIDALPPELLRRGRFDEIFFMDLPQPQARKEIVEIHLKQRNRTVEAFDVDRIVSCTEGFSGAEIEHVIVEGLFNAYHHKRELDTNDIIGAAGETIPLSITYAEELRGIREWAKSRARPADAAPPTSSEREG